MAEMDRYRSSSVGPARALSGRERAVLQEGRIMLAINAVRSRARAEAAQLDVEALLDTQVTVATSIARVLAYEETISDPRVLDMMKRFDQWLLEAHCGHLRGYYRIVAQRIAEQLDRDIYPEPVPPAPHTFWQQVFSAALYGE